MDDDDFMRLFCPSKVLNVRTFTPLMPVAAGDNYRDSAAWTQHFEVYALSVSRDGSEEYRMLTRWWYDIVVPRLVAG